MITKWILDEDKIIRLSKGGRVDDINLLLANKVAPNFEMEETSQRKHRASPYVSVATLNPTLSSEQNRPQRALIKRKSKRQSPTSALCKFAKIDFRVDIVTFFRSTIV